jgi:uncharacterized protein (TIGR02996 family)
MHHSLRYTAPTVSDEREPQYLLDAIADAPDALAPWRVLADWLLEHGAPHAVLAAYESRLEDGTSDLELMDAIAEARQARARPPSGVGFIWSDATWRCGYITRLVVSLGLHYPEFDWQALFDAPQLRMLQWLQLKVAPRRRNPQKTARTLRRVLAVAPSTLRRISVFTQGSGALTLAELEPLTERPERVRRLDLALGPAGVATVDAIARLGDAGYPLISLDGTTLLPEGALALRDRHGRRLRFAGTGLNRAAARELDDSRVAWCAPDVNTAIVRDTGELVPLTYHASRLLHHPAWRQREFQPTFTGWQAVYPAPPGEDPLTVDLQDDGQLVMLSGGLVRVLRRDDLDAAYREVLAGPSEGTAAPVSGATGSTSR